MSPMANNLHRNKNGFIHSVRFIYELLYQYYICFKNNLNTKLQVMSAIVKLNVAFSFFEANILNVSPSLGQCE